ncbi:MAG: type I DNA topoisomerase [Alphaproteobacteria bacterium]|nr:type I DNA topoisomerase [Alphaproteobacteria bacterium]
MSAENIVVVESPAKAKTINKYLGRDFRVLASFGHVRDLPPKDGSVLPDRGFAMSWQMDERGRKHVGEIAKAVKGASRLYLATDPDREGEAISWHVREALASRKALNGVEVSRVVFHEVTRNAVLDAVANPRAINQELVDAYLARRALDYLVGFTLSPVLWRKLPGARSAGRVQSVALRLVCDREAEIEAFRAREYWTVDADFETAAGAAFRARLTHLDGRKLGTHAIADEAAALAIKARLEDAAYRIAAVEKRQARRNPAPPFTTSTLQQEASRRLGFGAARTMRIAQQLYEGVDLGGESVGLITYMRTDSVAMSGEALAGARRLIERDFGDAYLPPKPRRYRSSARNAQEAHEAVRPTDMGRRPQDVRDRLKPEQFRLYELVWRRAVASQMAAAVFDRAAVDVAATDGRAVLRATGSVIRFDGYLKLYREGRDDAPDGKANGEDEDQALPPVSEGEPAQWKAVEAEQHFTQPPPRYTEASLVKRLEELGIGRPSTYASIIQVLQDRDYVRLESRRFLPEDRGRIVTAFLQNFFERYVEYEFTADLEEKLDAVSNGRIDWRALLQEFWDGFQAKVEETQGLRISNVIDALDKELDAHFFPPGDNGQDPRLCPVCGEGRLGLRLGRHGAFFGCSRYPDCRHVRPLTVPEAGDENGPRVLGDHPESGLEVSVRKGPYGFYVQLAGEDGNKPKRVSTPRGMDPAAVTLQQALGLLSLPREVGQHPETGKSISAGLGRYGPYLRHDGAYVSIPRGDDVLEIGLNRAVALIADKKGGRAAGPLKELGAHPADGKPVTVHKGRYGPYVKHGRIMASLPKGQAPEAATLEAALPLLEQKKAAGGKTGGRKAAAKPKAAPAKGRPRKTAAAKKPGPRGAA